MHLNEILSSILKIEGGALFYTPPFFNKGYSFIFNKPSIILEADNIYGVNNVLDEAERLREEYTGYCYLTYEAGYLMEERLKSLFVPTGENAPFIKFLFYRKEDFIKIPSHEIIIDYTAKGDCSVADFKLDTIKTEYISKVNFLRDHIYKGNTYQVNYTVKGKYSFKGDVKALFTKLIFNQTAAYTSFINNGNELFICLSPELFFEVGNGKITAKPMKGTIKRGVNIEEDRKMHEELKNSGKDKSENVMIVDLLRNDIGRVSRFNSVEVPALYTIEKYESLYQMISEVSGQLNEGITLKDIIRNIYPCGSITGAPKIRTMEIINSVEKEKRGIYTGTIGLLEPGRVVCNVAIRTLCIDKKTGTGEIGIGSGIVADSVPEKEYDECLLKCNFLLKPLDYFELFETMRIEDGGVFLLREHLLRLKEAASYFLFIYDETKIVTKLNEILSLLNSDEIYRLKLTLTKSGAFNFEYSTFSGNTLHKIIISDKLVSTSNQFQYFKTTNRLVYSSEYDKYKEHYTDAVFFNEKGELAEGSITNIIIKQNGEWVTPPVSSGILNGVYRMYLLQNGLLKEKILSKEDLLNAREVKLINSLRKEINIDSIHQNQSIVI